MTTYRVKFKVGPTVGAVGLQVVGEDEIATLAKILTRSGFLFAVELEEPEVPAA